MSLNFFVVFYEANMTLFCDYLIFQTPDWRGNS